MISLTLLAAGIANGTITPWFALAAYATKSLVIFVFAKTLFNKDSLDLSMFVTLGILVV